MEVSFPLWLMHLGLPPVYDRGLKSLLLQGFLPGTTMFVEETAGEGVDLSDFSFFNALSKH